MKIDALQKWQNELLADLSPAIIGFLKHSYRSGRLLDIDRLYSTMFHDWDVLQKDCCDMEEAVRSLEWSVMPKCKAGEEPDALAQEVAQVVEEALWRRSTGYEARAYSHTFPELVGALVHALFRGYNVHEIVWENDGELVFPARYVQLPAQFLAWEDKAGRPDRLLLIRDGMGEEPVPFPAWKFIVALNTTGPDHPIFNAAYFSLVKWFTAFKFGLGWYMEYCQKYGIPTKVIEYGSEAEKQKIIASMQDERVLNTVFVQEGRKYEMGHAPASGASLPQRDLVQLAEAACHKLILGQTLTSDTSAHGGSLAQARVHAGVQADVVKKRAEYVAEVLNAQLIPAIVLANFGRLEGMPLPELRCKLPEAVANTQKAQFWQAVLAIPGMRVKQSEVYESLGVAAPGEGDEVFGAAGGDDGSGGAKAKVRDEADAQVGKEAVQGAKVKEEKKQDAAQVWLEPLRRELQEARRKGSTLADIRAGLAKWRPDTHALADVFAENAEQGFFGVQEELQADDVAAANPYGCNQYGEGWRQPHNGLGSKPGKPVKKGDKKAEKQGASTKEDSADEPIDKKSKEKRVFKPAKNKAEARKATADLLVGKNRGDVSCVKWHSRMPLDKINEVNETLTELLDKYDIPLLSGVGSYVARGGNGDNEGAVCRTRTNWGEAPSVVEIGVNVDHERGGVFGFDRWKPYKDDSIRKNEGWERSNVGATEKGISIRDVVRHEFGHALHAFVKKKQDIRAQVIKRDVESAFRKANENGDIKKISYYASTSQSEFFAECFAARERGEKLPDYINKMLDGVVRYATLGV